MPRLTLIIAGTKVLKMWPRSLLGKKVKRYYCCVKCRRRSRKGDHRNFRLIIAGRRDFADYALLQKKVNVLLALKAIPTESRSYGKDADACICFWNNRSHGTKLMTDLAKAAQLPPAGDHLLTVRDLPNIPPEPFIDQFCQVMG